MEINSEQKADELQVPLLAVEQSRPVPEIPDTSLGIMCYKPVSVPVFGSCLFIAAIVTSSILLLPTYVSYFKPYWVQWYYLNDFQASEVFSTQNDTRIDYTNATLLHNTVFNYDNDEGIPIYDDLKIVIQLNSEETIDEFNIKLQATNLSMSDTTAIDAKSELLYRPNLAADTWYKYDTKYNVTHNGKMISILSTPTEEAGTCTSSTYRITINNQLHSANPFEAVHLSLKTHKQQLYKTVSVVFLGLFAFLSLFNLGTWTKIIRESNLKSFRLTQPVKYKILLLTTVHTIYWTFMTAAALCVDETWLTQSDYYSIRLLVIAFSFYLCFVTNDSTLSAFYTISWAFIPSNTLFHSMQWYFNVFIHYGKFVLGVLFVLSIVSVATGIMVQTVNQIVNFVTWMLMVYLCMYGGYLTWKYYSIYNRLYIANKRRIFDEYLFVTQRSKLLQKGIFTFWMLELSIFMMLCVWFLLQIDNRDDAMSLCYYLSTIAAFCMINSIFYRTNLPLHLKCDECGFEEQIADSSNAYTTCKNCGGHEILPREPTPPNNSSHISMENMNVIKSLKSHKKVIVNQQVFSANQMVGNVETPNALARLKELCAVFDMSQTQEFASVFEELPDYSLALLLNDYLHLLQSDKLQTMTYSVGTCEKMEQCSMIQSPIDASVPLLIKTMIQIHCYLFHNIKQMTTVRKKKFFENIDEVIEEEQAGQSAIQHHDVIEEEIDNKELEEVKIDANQELTETLPMCPICELVLSRQLPSNCTTACFGCATLCDNSTLAYFCQNLQLHQDTFFCLCKKCGLVAFKLQNLKKQSEDPEAVEAEAKGDDNYGYDGEYKYNEYGFGSFIYYDLLKEKFPSLKSELLNNGLYSINIQEWDHIMTKANCRSQTTRGREFRDLKTGNPIYIQHLISIICYTDFHELCTHFRDSFRKLHKNETEKQVIQRHCDNFYHLGKWLNHSVSNYGSLLSEFDGTLYHAVNGKFLFESMCTDFNIPTSATAHFDVAQQFTRDGGMILELTSKWQDARWNKAQCLPVDWISCYGYEKEVLFFGNFNQLRIDNITFLSDASDVSDVDQTNVRTYLRAIHLWELICDGYASVSEFNNKLVYQFLDRLLKERLSQTTDDFRISEYVLKLFHHICDRRTEYSLQGIWRMNWEYNEVNDRHELQELSDLLDTLMYNVTLEDIIENIRCECNDTMVKRRINKTGGCDGCRGMCDAKNMMGFHCKIGNCNYCLHGSCAKMVVNVTRVLPNAKHHHSLDRLDEFKMNAFKIELLRSAGLW
eukprot:357289_1